MSSRATIFSISVPTTLKLITVNSVIDTLADIEVVSSRSFKDE